MRFRLHVLSVMLFVLSLVSVCAFTQGPMVDNALFQAVPNGQGSPGLSGKYGVVRFRFVTVNTSIVGSIAADGQIVPATSLSLNLFDDMVVLAKLDRLERSPVGGWIWIGHIAPPSTGTVILAFNESTVSCTTVVEGRRFQVRNDGGPLHVIRELTLEVGADRLASMANAPLMSTTEMDVYARVNQERSIRGLYAYAPNETLANAARDHSLDMANRGYFAHNTPEGTTPGDRITTAGYTWSAWAENIASGQASPAEVMEAWMNSPPHRANILGTSCCDIGVGYAQVPGSPYTHYWTQDFGKLQGVTTCPVVPATPVLSVSPDTRNVSQGAGTTTFSVSNSGGGTMNWSASVTTGASWLQITSGTSGTNAGTISLSYSANPSTSARTGTVTVSAPGATGSPVSVNIVQAGQTSTTNRPPTVTLTYSPANPTPADTVVFTATASDPDGDTLSYSWYLDGAEQTGVTNSEVRWNTPPAGTHTVRVVVSDGRGGMDDASVTLTVGNGTGRVSHTYESVAGWYIISVPVRASVSSGMTVYRWNPGTRAYEVPTVLEPEYGYWALLEGSATASIAGTPPTYNVTIPITSAGWHQISAAWGYPKSAIQVIKGSETKSWADAVTAGWLRDDIYGYKASDGSYSTPSTMSPWYGYWANARVSGLSLKLFYASSIPMSMAYTPMGATATSIGPTPDGLPAMPTTPSTNVADLVFSCSPNPITDVHTTTFSIEGAKGDSVSVIKVEIFDVSGRLVYEAEEAGKSLDWHTDNMNGQYLANGVYLYKISVLLDGHWVTSGMKSILVLR